MAETATHLVDQVFPPVPVRQWVLTFPIPLGGQQDTHAPRPPDPRPTQGPGPARLRLPLFSGPQEVW